LTNPEKKIKNYNLKIIFKKYEGIYKIEMVLIKQYRSIHSKQFQRNNSIIKMDSRSSRRYESSNSRHESNNKEQLSIQPMRYKLTKLTQSQALFQIAIKTSGFYTMSTNSADWIQRDVRSREFTSFGSLEAPKDMKLVNKITGDNDYFLKLTAANHDTDYICYASETNEFQFWGEYKSCIRSMNSIRYRIEKISQRELLNQGPISNDGAHDDVTDEPATKKQRCSKFSTTQINTTGFIPSNGVQRHNMGGDASINRMIYLGGSTENKCFGYWDGNTYVEFQDKEDVHVEEPQTDMGRSVSIELDEEEPPVGMMSNLSIVSEEDSESNTPCSMSITAD
jgi:hypothetical protein